MKRISTVALGRHLFVIAGLALASTVGNLSAADTYYVSDHLATTTAVADAAGEIASLEADAFGSPVSGSEQAARYTGKPYDADIGAYVFPFRNYRSDEAQWMSADPSGFPDGVNAQRYSPSALTEFDPLGLVTFSESTSYVAINLIPNNAAGSYTWNIARTQTALYSTSGSYADGYTASATRGLLYELTGVMVLPTVGSSVQNATVNQAFQNQILTHESWHRQIAHSFATVAYGELEAWSASYSSNLFNTSGQAAAAFSADLTKAYQLILNKYNGAFQTDKHLNHPNPGAGINSSGQWVGINQNWGQVANDAVNLYTFNFTKTAGNFSRE